MQKIIPHLWFDQEAKEAAEFYSAVFPDSRIASSYVLRDTPSGDCDVLSFDIWGQNFMSISAGPLFKINPSVSFIVNFDPLLFKGSASQEKEARKKIDEVWQHCPKVARCSCPLTNIHSVNDTAGFRIDTEFHGS